MIKKLIKLAARELTQAVASSAGSKLGEMLSDRLGLKLGWLTLEKEKTEDAQG